MKFFKYLLIVGLFLVSAKASLAFEYYQGYATCANDPSCYNGWYGGCTVESGGQAGGCSSTGSLAVCQPLGMLPGCSAWCDSTGYTANPSDPTRDWSKPAVNVVCACCKNFEICYPKTVIPTIVPKQASCDFSLRFNYCDGTKYKNDQGGLTCDGKKTCPGGTCVDSGTDAPDTCNCDDGSVCTDDAWDPVTKSCTHTFDPSNGPSCISPPLCGCPDPSQICGDFQSWWTSDGTAGCQMPILCSKGSLTCNPSCQECDDASGKCIEISACTPPAESCPSGCTDYDTSVPDGLGGFTSCPANCNNKCVGGVCIPLEGNCPTSCSDVTTFVPDGLGGNKTCPPNCATQCIAGICVVPEQACPVGCSDIDSLVPDGSGGFKFCPANCFTQCVAGVCQGNAPSFQDLVLKNEASVVVSAEAGNRNHICQTTFTNRKVIFEVQGFDADGLSDITNIRLRLGSNVYNPISLANGLAVFDVTFPIGGASTDNIEVNITDSVGLTTGWVNTGRSFKNWNCNVAISGTIYDSSTTGLLCPALGYSVPADSAVLNFKSLVFKYSGADVNVTVNPNGISYGPNNLTWGLNGYLPELNADIALNGQRMKSQSSTAAGPNCNWYIDTADVDPYSNNPSFTADFSGTVDQTHWWQALNGGVVSNNRVNNQVPSTCVSSCEISVGSLVSAPVVNNTGRNDAQTWSYSGMVAKLANVNTNYSYFYNQYFVKNAVGTTLNGDKNITDIGAAGIYFVDGNLTIDSNKIVAAGSFLMVIVKGDITVTQNVTRVDGILVANNINATGVSASQLVFNGSLFAFNNVDFSRDYSNKTINNTAPSVVVNYNPQLLFNLPASVAKVLTNWQWGN